ncbi:MAG: hypothetical protein Q7K26_01100 [bacterium]|nr:hypothetical protein [bacterium]
MKIAVVTVSTKVKLVELHQEGKFPVAMRLTPTPTLYSEVRERYMKEGDYYERSTRNLKVVLDLSILANEIEDAVLHKCGGREGMNNISEVMVNLPRTSTLLITCINKPTEV